MYCANVSGALHGLDFRMWHAAVLYIQLQLVVR